MVPVGQRRSPLPTKCSLLSSSHLPDLVLFIPPRFNQHATEETLSNAVVNLWLNDQVFSSIHGLIPLLNRVKINCLTSVSLVKVECFGIILPTRRLDKINEMIFGHRTIDSTEVKKTDEMSPNIAPTCSLEAVSGHRCRNHLPKIAQLLHCVDETE